MNPTSTPTGVFVADGSSNPGGSTGSAGDFSSNISDNVLDWITTTLGTIFGSSDLTDNWEYITHTLVKILGAVILFHP